MKLARSICRHEFGHYVAARALGFKTGIVRVEIGDNERSYLGSALIVPTEPHTSLQSVERHIHRRIVVLLSGACAETLNQSSKVEIEKAKRLLKTTACSDGEKAAELSSLLYGLKFAEAFTVDSIETALGPGKLWDDLLIKAASLIENHAELVIKLAEELLAKVRPGERASLDARVLDTHPLLTNLKQAEM
ncbi:hypothetical protein [Caulobacter soli]|uniref:hypothetical protein n=1 Tax=Caulobacter soli TaxID=2708539 RepID=UPI0013E9AC31|nr:hypothetical protein [Caulobacter soli]